MCCTIQLETLRISRDHGNSSSTGRPSTADYRPPLHRIHHTAQVHNTTDQATSTTKGTWASGQQHMGIGGAGPVNDSGIARRRQPILRFSHSLIWPGRLGHGLDNNRHQRVPAIHYNRITASCSRWTNKKLITKLHRRRLELGSPQEGRWARWDDGFGALPTNFWRDWTHS